MGLHDSLRGSPLVILLVPRYRQSERLLPLACGMVFLSLWIDKGIGLIVAAFVPSPLGAITEYYPSLPEIMICLGIWAVGMLILTVLYKIALSVREGLLFSPAPPARVGVSA